MTKLAEKTVRHLKNRWFYYLMLALPLAQVLVFYIYVNINSIILSMQDYDIYTNTFSFAGLKHFKEVISNAINEPQILLSVKNALTLFCLLWLLGFPLAIFISYFLSKDPKGSSFYQVVLYLPSIVSSVTFVLMFKYFCELCG